MDASAPHHTYRPRTCAQGRVNPLVVSGFFRDESTKLIHPASPILQLSAVPGLRLAQKADDALNHELVVEQSFMSEVVERDQL
jgi:hypothetical protein